MGKVITPTCAWFHWLGPFFVEVELAMTASLAVLRSNVLPKRFLEEVPRSTLVALVGVGHSGSFGSCIQYFGSRP